MRTMEIPPLPRKFENTDLPSLFKTMLSQEIVLWPNQAMSLVAYIARPDDPARREEMRNIMRNWANGSKTALPPIRQIQVEWARVADIFHVYVDLVD